MVGELEAMEEDVVFEKEKIDQDEASTYTLITDGSQFKRSFWDAEVQSLQNLIQRQQVGRKEIPSRRIPTADELQIQFITWLVDQPNYLS